LFIADGGGIWEEKWDTRCDEELYTHDACPTSRRMVTMSAESGPDIKISTGPGFAYLLSFPLTKWGIPTWPSSAWLKG